MCGIFDGVYHFNAPTGKRLTRIRRNCVFKGVDTSIIGVFHLFRVPRVVRSGEFPRLSMGGNFSWQELEELRLGTEIRGTLAPNRMFPQNNRVYNPGMAQKASRAFGVGRRMSIVQRYID